MNSVNHTEQLADEFHPAADESQQAHLSDEEIKEIVDAVREQDSDTVHAALRDLSIVDTAELLAKIKEDDRHELVSMYGDILDPEIYTEMNPELCKSILSEMPPASVAEIVAELESDDGLLIIQNLDPVFQKEIIQNLSSKTRLALEEGLSFPEDSAGRLMRRELVAIPEFWTVGKTIDYLRTASENLPEEFYDIFIIDPAHHLVGEVPLSRLIKAQRSEKIKDLKLDVPHPIEATTDQEEVAHIFRRDDILSAPVVDKDNRLIGVITIDDIVDVIDEEAQEDIMRMAGVDQDDLYRAVMSTASTRFRWLFINLLTAILASIVISFFDATIEQVVALAVLMPIVASMGGNAGTQALTVAVRALATREISSTNTWRVIWKETIVGTINGILFAVLSGFMAAFWFQSAILGTVIAIAMIINLIVAGLFGAGIPVFLNRFGADPAISSTVILTTVTDVVGFLSFLGLAALLIL
ncbi:MAG: magnesium transporter [Alphaproteobacteria bacterium]|nr:magnesium transporter [Alphaproteobacteria bacterium]